MNARDRAVVEALEVLRDLLTERFGPETEVTIGEVVELIEMCIAEVKGDRRFHTESAEDS